MAGYMDLISRTVANREMQTVAPPRGEVSLWIPSSIQGAPKHSRGIRDTFQRRKGRTQDYRQDAT